MFNTISDRLVLLASSIQQIPAPTFSEDQRANFIYEMFKSEGLSEVTIDQVGNVLACLPGAGVAKPVIVVAHLDTVFPSDIPLTLQRKGNKLAGAGIGDNAVGIASLFALLWKLRQELRQLPGDLWLVGSVGEEGLGDLRGMRAIVERFNQQVAAYIVVEGMALGQVFHRALAIRRYHVQVNTRGGHSWVDHGTPSAVHQLAKLITQLTSLPIPESPRTTLNVGKVQGGTSVNTIANEACLELDLRSENAATLVVQAMEVEKLVLQANVPGVRSTLSLIGDRPAGEISADHPLVGLAVNCLQEQGIKPRLNIGSTDANIPLSQGLPAVCVGITSGRFAHTPQEQINLAPINKGMHQLVELVQGAFSLPVITDTAI